MFGQFFLNFNEDVFSAIKISTNRANLVSRNAAVWHYVSAIFGVGLDIRQIKEAGECGTRQLIAVLSGKFQ